MRPARARINLDALRQNYLLTRQQHGRRALAVIKANAYGHGALPCARALEDVADGFAVAVIEEAMQLREGGIRSPILVLEGPFAADEIALALRHSLWLVVHHHAQLQWLDFEPSPEHGKLDIWLKLNTGMNRAGFEADAYRKAWQKLKACPLVSDIVLMTHLARADEPESGATIDQISRFDATTEGLPGDRSIANSAGVLAWPETCRDWARPGIALYGADPMPTPSGLLRPVMTLESEIMAVRDIPKGATVGYGARFRAERPSRVGLVAMGYADGYPRSAPDGTPVWVAGQRTRLIGRVSMDMLTVDITDIPDAVIGSPVELWGSQVSVNEVAQLAGTIAYELLCNVKRVRKLYE